MHTRRMARCTPPGNPQVPFRTRTAKGSFGGLPSAIFPFDLICHPFNIFNCPKEKEKIPWGHHEKFRPNKQGISLRRSTRNSIPADLPDLPDPHYSARTYENQRNPMRIPWIPIRNHGIPLISVQPGYYSWKNHPILANHGIRTNSAEFLEFPGAGPGKWRNSWNQAHQRGFQHFPPDPILVHRAVSRNLMKSLLFCCVCILQGVPQGWRKSKIPPKFGGRSSERILG